MVQVNYIQERDELEIVFKEIDVPEVLKMDNGVVLEFDEETLSTIILPNFWQMVHRQLMHQTPPTEASIKFKNFTTELIRLNINGQDVNIKLNLKELENR